MKRENLLVLGFLAAVGVGAGAFFLAGGVPNVAVPPDTPAPAPSASNGATKPNVLIVLWDTVRADRLSLYGHDRTTTPHLDAFAKDAVVYENAISASFWTLPAHASIFTGLSPKEHGAHVHNAPWLDDEFVTLAEWFSQHDYDTYAWTSNPYVTAKTGVLQGFETIDMGIEEPWLSVAHQAVETHAHPRDKSTRFSPARPNRQTDKLAGAAGEATAQAFSEWLDARAADRPFLAYLNYMEAHHPRFPTAESRKAMIPDDQVREAGLLTNVEPKRQAQAMTGGRAYQPIQHEAMLGVYDASIRDLDARTQRIFDDLAQRGLLDDTIVVVVADHGEQFGEHGLYVHNYSVYDTLIHVPLVVRYPKVLKPGRVDAAVSTQSLYASLVDWAGLERPEGTVLPPLVYDNSDPTYSDLVSPTGGARPNRPRLQRKYRAIIEGQWKLIHASDGSMELYDRVADPGEIANLADSQPDVVQRLRQQLDARHAAQQPLSEGPDEDVMDEELRKSLEELGYIE